MKNIISELDFSKSNVLIVGDLILDRYYYGSVSRISPEAPVPVVHVNNESMTMGGAGNVANNIKGLTGNTIVIGCAKDDEAGNILKQMFHKICAEYKFIDSGLPTISKLRVIGSKQQIVRLDFEELEPYTKEVNNQIKESIDRYIVKSSLIVISDYGKGICSYEICQYIIQKAAEYNKQVIVDPKGSNWEKYHGSYIITPNVKELSEAFGKDIINEDEDVLKAGKYIKEKYNIKYLIVTRSEKGMMIIADNYHKIIPTVAREVFDVSGAGDTVVACLAVFLSLKVDMDVAVSFANTAAGVVVGKLGTAPISISELSHSVQGIYKSKLIKYENIENVIEQEKLNNNTIVFTNGCFDILHRGHLTYLRKAKSLGDRLVIGLNSDSSVKMLKGENRPINNEQDRALMLEALEFVDYIIVFNDETPFELIKLVKPNILVKGGDYKIEEVVGKEFAGRVEIIEFVDGYSTTNTINKINDEVIK